MRAWKIGKDEAAWHSKESHDISSEHGGYQGQQQSLEHVAVGVLKTKAFSYTSMSSPVAVQ